VAVRAVLDTFSSEGLSAPGRSPGNLAESLTRLRENPLELATWMPVVMCAVTIRWASEETGRGEIEIVDALAKQLEDTTTRGSDEKAPPLFPT
jgi:hypothetical protein